MPSPFPGMDPYLESPAIWPDVHHELISQIRAVLNPALRPRYVARVELRVYISDDEDPGRRVLVPDVRVEETLGRKETRKRKESSSVAVSEPLIVATLVDEEIKEAFVKVIEVDTEALVTVIEVLSPANKVRGSRGRESFLAKRRQILDTEVHWVEIDLLRAGAPSRPLRPCDYRILISRGDDRSRTRFWPIGVRQPLPAIPIPLREQEHVDLDLGSVLRAAYDRAAYDSSLDYNKDPDPPLEGADARWARDLIRGRHKKK